MLSYTTIIYWARGVPIWRLVKYSDIISTLMLNIYKGNKKNDGEYSYIFINVYIYVPFIFDYTGSWRIWKFPHSGIWHLVYIPPFRSKGLSPCSGYKITVLAERRYLSIRLHCIKSDNNIIFTVTAQLPQYQGSQSVILTRTGAVPNMRRLDMATKLTNAYICTKLSYIIKTAFFLHVLAALVAIFLEVRQDRCNKTLNKFVIQCTDVKHFYTFTIFYIYVHLLVSLPYLTDQGTVVDYLKVTLLFRSVFLSKFSNIWWEMWYVCTYVYINKTH